MINQYSNLVLAGLGDNRKLFRLLHKATIIQEASSEMVRDGNSVPFTSDKDRLIIRKEFIEANVTTMRRYTIC